MENKYSSHETNVIDAALGKAQNEILGKIEKDKTASAGAKFSYQYASWDSIIKTVFPVLKDNGITVLQPYQYEGEIFGIATILSHSPSKQWRSSFVPVNFQGKTEQQCGTNTTYMKRYSLSTFLGIAADEDTDGQVEKSAPKDKSYLEKQTQEIPISKDNLQHLTHEVVNKPILLDRIMAKYNVASLNDLYDREYLEIISMIKAIKQ